MRQMVTVVTVAACMVWGLPTASAEQGPAERRGTLARTLRDVWLPLESGLTVAAREGLPLSAKYEIGDTSSSCRYTR